MSQGRGLFQRAKEKLSGQGIPLATVFLAAVGFGAYAVGAVQGQTYPGSLLGLGFGIAATGVLAGVMLYSVRRGLARVRKLGPQQRYMRLHVWGGVLFLFLFLLHTDFRMPRGVLTATLWAVTLWVVLSGLVGTLLQRSFPRILRSTASFEVHLRRIPGLVDELRKRAEEVAGRAPPRVREFYERELAPEMAAPRMVGTALFGSGTSEERSAPAMDILRRTLPEDGASTLDELRDLHRAKQDMDLHFTLQRILRGWLWLHLPVSILLLGLVILHVFLIVYF